MSITFSSARFLHLSRTLTLQCYKTWTSSLRKYIAYSPEAHNRRSHSPPRLEQMTMATVHLQTFPL
jgi:hypothetical protein